MSIIGAISARVGETAYCWFAIASQPVSPCARAGLRFGRSNVVAGFGGTPGAFVRLVKIFR